MNDAIAEVYADDLQKARRFVRGAISQASEAWLPSEAVLDALTLELIEVAGRHASPARIVVHLTEVAALLKRAQARSH